MIFERPDYYNQFSCIAGDCPMTCCAGWEVDVDAASRDFFLELEGPIGDEVRSVMVDSEDGGDYAVFPLTDEGNCPFLASNKLCRLYSALGEEGFCETCSEYPRYFGVTGSHQQIDLTLSCPEVVRIFFATTSPVTFVTTEDIMDGEELSVEETRRLSEVYRFRDAVMEDLTNAFSGSEFFPEILLSHSKDLSTFDTATLPDLLASTEVLDERWQEVLDAIQTTGSHQKAFPVNDTDIAPFFLRLAQYFLFRYSIDIFYGSSKDDILLLILRSLTTILWIYESGWCALPSQSCRLTLDEKELSAPLSSKEEKVIRLMDATLIFSRQIEHSLENVEILKKARP